MDPAAIRSAVMDKIARVLRFVGLAWGAIGIFTALSMLLEAGAPDVMPDAGTLAEAGIVLASNLVPGAFLVFLASKLRRTGPRGGAELARLGQAINRMADAKAHADTQARSHGDASHGARAGVIRAAESPTVAGRAARRSVIER